jgi:hypothetical protein
MTSSQKILSKMMFAVENFLTGIYTCSKEFLINLEDDDDDVGARDHSRLQQSK